MIEKHVLRLTMGRKTYITPNQWKKNMYYAEPMEEKHVLR